MAAINPIKPALFILVLALGVLSLAQARTSLVSLPLRQQVAIRLDDSGTTLVQEKRRLLLKKGVNKIDFSWQNVMIDPSSITLETLSHPGRIRMLSVSYPPNEAALVWDIASPDDLEEEVMISYLLANIDSVLTYTAMAGPGERTLDLKSFLVLRNFSGETFDAVTVYPHSGHSFVTAIQDLETKTILVSETRDLPIKKIYTWDALTMPHEPEKSKNTVGIPTSYELKTALFQGKVRLFQTAGQDSTIFLGEDTARFTPVGDTSSFRIGDSRDLIVSQHRMDTKRTRIRRNTKGDVQVYDEIITDRITMENLKESPVTLSLIESIPGQWEPVAISMPYERKDHKTLVFNVSLLPKEKKILTLNYTLFNIFAGRFSRYNRVAP